VLLHQLLLEECTLNMQIYKKNTQTNPKVNLYECKAGYFHSSLVRTTFFPPQETVNEQTNFTV